MRAPMELTVRRLVADHLGVGVGELGSEVSLRDDLAADSLDLVELAMALEAAFAIEVPEPILEHVRSFGDLIRATDLLIGARCEAESRGAESPTRIWARIVPGAGRPGGTVERTAWLTPYIVETIAEDAMRAGPGSRLELTVAGSLAGGLTRVWDQFARLRHHGIPVSIRDGSGSMATPVRSVADRVAERHRVAAASGYSNGA
jgi:acyl carrier protein